MLVTAGVITTGDHCRIAWESDGPADAPPLILANSLGTTMAMWEPQLEALKTRFRVIRYDMRGHGKSDAPAGAYSIDRLGRDVIELADGLGLGLFAFCGLSLGGMVGQWLGWRHPARIEKLVIANSSPFMGPPSAWDARIDLVRASGMAAIADAVVDRWFTPEFKAAGPAAGAVLDMLLATSPEGYAGCCAAIRDMDMRPVLSLIQSPTLVIGGSRDPATPPEHSQMLADHIGGALLKFLPAAHLSSQEQTGQFNEALASFLMCDVLPFRPSPNDKSRKSRW